MDTFPADEPRISGVEGSLCAGDTVLFALSAFRAGLPPCFVKGGDAVLVSLTSDSDLDETDAATGPALDHLRRAPPGQVRLNGPTAARRVVKASRSWGPA